MFSLVIDESTFQLGKCVSRLRHSCPRECSTPVDSWRIEHHRCTVRMIAVGNNPEYNMTSLWSRCGVNPISLPKGSQPFVKDRIRTLLGHPSADEDKTSGAKKPCSASQILWLYSLFFLSHVTDNWRNGSLPVSGSKQIKNPDVEECSLSPWSPETIHCFVYMGPTVSVS